MFVQEEGEENNDGWETVCKMPPKQQPHKVYFYSTLHTKMRFGYLILFIASSLHWTVQWGFMA